MNYSLKQFLRLRIAWQTFKDNFRITLILTFIFILMASMYAGMYPAFKDSLTEMESSGFTESFNFLSGAQDMASYVGFLNLELYQIFWILILGILISFASATLISKEIEGKTIDLLMSNPISRKQIVFEKFLGVIPTTIIINFATFFVIIIVTIVINEELDFYYLFLTHVASIPYFIAIVSIGVLLSVFINEKMKASIIMIAILIGMYIFQSISLMIPDYEHMGAISITRYLDTYDILKFGEVNISNIFVLIGVITICLTISMIYFEHKDIEV